MHKFRYTYISISHVYNYTQTDCAFMEKITKIICNRSFITGYK